MLGINNKMNNKIKKDLPLQGHPTNLPYEATDWNLNRKLTLITQSRRKLKSLTSLRKAAVQIDVVAISL